MSKALSEESHRFLVIASDASGVHLYQLRANGADLNRARIKFELLVEQNHWDAFDKVEVIRLGSDEELESLSQLGPEQFR